MPISKKNNRKCTGECAALRSASAVARFSILWPPRLPPLRVFLPFEGYPPVVSPSTTLSFHHSRLTPFFSESPLSKSPLFPLILPPPLRPNPLTLPHTSPRLPAVPPHCHCPCRITKSFLTLPHSYLITRLHSEPPSLVSLYLPLLTKHAFQPFPSSTCESR